MVHGVQHLAFLGARGVRIETGGRLHGRERQELERMAPNHVAHRTDRIVEASAPLDPDGFRYRDLDMIDALAVPYWLKDAVSEAQHHDVLDRLFPEIVVDSVDLVFAQHRKHLTIHLAGR